MMPSFVHQPSHALGIDDVALALELLGQAPIAVRRPLPGDLEQCFQERPVLTRPRFVVGAAARQIDSPCGAD